MGSRSRRVAGAFAALAATAITLAATAGSALGAFPYTRPGGNAHDFTDLYLTRPGARRSRRRRQHFKFAATADPSNTIDNARPTELGGVRGAHVADADSCANTAFEVTLGRPDVSIAVLDSGIKWNDAGAMSDLRLKVRLNRGELPLPQHGDGSACGSYDCNGDGVFNVADYASDPRVNLGDSRRDGPAGVLVPAGPDRSPSPTAPTPTATATSTTSRAGTSSTTTTTRSTTSSTATAPARRGTPRSEADNGGQLGTCPNCTVLPLRVGDSFVADVNRFAAAVALRDRQRRLGGAGGAGRDRTTPASPATPSTTRTGHGVTVIASAADEAAQHNNWPSSLPHVILVNSVDATA